MKGPQLLQSSGILVPDKGIQTFYGQLSTIVNGDFQVLLEGIRNSNVPSSTVYGQCQDEFQRVNARLCTLIPGLNLVAKYNDNWTNKWAYAWTLSMFLLEKAYSTEFNQLTTSSIGSLYYNVANNQINLDFGKDLGLNLLVGY